MRFRPLLALLSLTTLLAACGQETASPIGEATPVNIDGAWFVTAYQVGVEARSPGINTAAVLDLNTATVALEGAAGCGTFYGSFTFGTEADAAFAGFTIPGRSESQCTDETRAEQDLVIAALEGTTAYAVEGQALVLTGPNSSATLTPAS